jgi:hypothetical protein
MIAGEGLSGYYAANNANDIESYAKSKFKTYSFHEINYHDIPIRDRYLIPVNLSQIDVFRVNHLNN